MTEAKQRIQEIQAEIDKLEAQKLEIQKSELLPRVAGEWIKNGDDFKLRALDGSTFVVRGDNVFIWDGYDEVEILAEDFLAFAEYLQNREQR